MIEGWTNNLTPEALLNKEVIAAAIERMLICHKCDSNSKNRKGYKSIRVDEHCIECGCTLSAKTKCLTCECPLKKWLAKTKSENENS